MQGLVIEEPSSVHQPPSVPKGGETQEEVHPIVTTAKKTIKVATTKWCWFAYGVCFGLLFWFDPKGINNLPLYAILLVVAFIHDSKTCHEYENETGIEWWTAFLQSKTRIGIHMILLWVFMAMVVVLTKYAVGLSLVSESFLKGGPTGLPVKPGFYQYTVFKSQKSMDNSIATVVTVGFNLTNQEAFQPIVEMTCKSMDQTLGFPCLEDIQRDPSTSGIFYNGHAYYDMDQILLVLDRLIDTYAETSSGIQTRIEIHTTSQRLFSLLMDGHSKGDTSFAIQAGMWIVDYSDDGGYNFVIPFTHFQAFQSHLQSLLKKREEAIQKLLEQGNLRRTRRMEQAKLEEERRLEKERRTEEDRQLREHNQKKCQACKQCWLDHKDSKDEDEKCKFECQSKQKLCYSDGNCIIVENGTHGLPGPRGPVGPS
jgi:hypothetical protein